MTRRSLLLALPALLALGCAGSPPPQPVELAEEMPPVWSAAEGTETAPAAGPWWETFADPRLDELIVQGMSRNNDLAAAAARVDAATARARIAGADAVPQIGLGGSASRRRQNFIGLPIPGNEGSVLSSTTTSFGASLNISWEADLWGRLRAGEAAAIAGVEAAQADLAAARLSLAGQTAKAWFAVLEASEQAQLSEETRASRRLTSERIRRRFDRGLAGALDLRLAISNEENATASLAAQRARLDAAERQLEILLSRYPARHLREGIEESTLPQQPPPPPAGLPAEIIARRPDLLGIERRLAAAGMGIRQARAALYPSVSLTGSAGRLSSEIEDLLESDFSVWSLAANLLQPIFQGGRLRGAVQLNEALYEELARSYAQAVLRAFGEVERSLAARRLLDDQVAALRRSAEQAAAAQKLAEERYDAGLTGYLLVLESQRLAFQARSQLLSAQRQLLDNQVDLHLALGGDFSS